MAAAARLSVCVAVSGKAQRGVPFGAQRRRALAQCVPPGAVLLFALETDFRLSAAGSSWGAAVCLSAARSGLRDYGVQTTRCRTVNCELATCAEEKLS